MKYIRQFGSLDEFIRYSEPKATHPTSVNQSETISEHTTKWTGTESKEQAFALLTQGHPEGLEKMKRILSELHSQITLPTMSHCFVSSVEGCAPDVEAYVQGLPEDMVEIVPVEMEAPPSILDVQMEMCFSCHHDTEIAMLSGAIIYAAIEALRMQGCQVNLLVCYTVQNNSDHYWQAYFPLTSATDIDTATFVFTHPSMLRRIVLSTMEQEDLKIRNSFGFYASSSYGYPSNLPHTNYSIQLSIPHISNGLASSPKQNRMAKAVKIFQALVDSKFQQIK